MDWTGFAFPKAKPNVLVKRTKAKAEDRAWAETCKQVDARDKRQCFVTGVQLTPGSVDAWTALERHHLEPRSKSTHRRYTVTNVVTTSRAVHHLIHAGCLKLLNKKGQKATSVESIDHVAWNRAFVAKGDEPVRIRKGLPVLKD